MPLPGSGAPGQFPPPTDPWSAPTPPPPVSGPPGPPAYAGTVVAQIGEIAVTPTTARTPAGDIPLAGSTWQVSDFWHTEQKTPTWAILVAIFGFCVLTVFSLLFLMVKETTYRGTVQVTVTNGPRQYVARIPVTAEAHVQHIHQQVNYVRSLAAL
jgi:hypothetical protein